MLLQEKLCAELEKAKELHTLDMQQAIEREQAIAATFSEEVKDLKLVGLMGSIEIHNAMRLFSACVGYWGQCRGEGGFTSQAS